MPDNRQTIEDFYSAFARLDAARMNACYAPDATFDDEAFCLRGAQQVGSMWSMLCEATRTKGADVWKLSWRDVHAEGSTGRAHWDAHYRLSTTGRIVDNSIDARFSFTPEGLIATHHDRFDFWVWSRQALGTPGLLLGWSPFLKKVVRARAAKTLAAFNARQS